MNNDKINNDKEASTLTPTNTRSFTEVLFTAYSFILFTLGFLIVFFPKEFDVFILKGDNVEIAYIYAQFIGSFELLASFLIFSLRKLKGRVIYYSVVGLITTGFINLYLLSSLSDYIILPSVYFIFQIIVLVSFIVALIEQVKRR